MQQHEQKLAAMLSHKYDGKEISHSQKCMLEIIFFTIKKYIFNFYDVSRHTLPE
jgi:hypothetical protein